MVKALWLTPYSRLTRYNTSRSGAAYEVGSIVAKVHYRMGIIDNHDLETWSGAEPQKVPTGLDGSSD